MRGRGCLIPIDEVDEELQSKLQFEVAEGVELADLILVAW